MQAAEGDAQPREILQDGWCRCPRLQQVRFFAYKIFFGDMKAYQPIKSQSPRVSHDEQYLSHFASLRKAVFPDENMECLVDGVVFTWEDLLIGNVVNFIE